MVPFVICRSLRKALEVPIGAVAVCHVVAGTCKFKVVVVESRFRFAVAHKGSLFLANAHKDRSKGAGPGIGRALKVQVRRSRMAPHDIDMVVARIGRPISVKIERCAVTGKGTCRQRLTQPAVHKANRPSLRVQGTDSRRIRQIPRGAACKIQDEVVCRQIFDGVIRSCSHKRIGNGRRKSASM